MDKLSAIAPESKIVIEDDQKCLIVDGKHVFLTRSEFNIVAYLAARPFVVRSREQILDHVYGNAGMGERSIDSLVKRTRLKGGSSVRRRPGRAGTGSRRSGQGR